jgi:hypothetical protein
MVESITDGPNYIVYHFLANIVDPNNDSFLWDDDNNYEMDGLTRIRLTRVALVAAIDLIP